MFAISRITRRGIAGATAAIVALACMASVASADVWDPWIPPTSGGWGNCTIQSGFIQDTLRPWKAIGGGTVNCAGPHNGISINVRLFLDGQLMKTQTLNIEGTTHGTGYTASGETRKVETKRACGNGNWATIVCVSIGGYSGMRSVTTPGFYYEIPC